MTLRKHQAELRVLCREILANYLPVRTIVAEVTPGGGKSLLPVILAEELIRPGYADRMLWIVPRNSLREQGERDFCINSSMQIRSATNGRDMSRGTCGYITTYQAIAADPEAHYRETREGRWIVFADEPHHVAEGSLWHKALNPVIDRSALRVFATGTAYRADARPIAFFSVSQEEKARIVYTRADALRDGAVCPVSFVAIDGEATWRERDGSENGVTSLAESGDYSPAALFTALRTEFADHLLDLCLADWQRDRQSYPKAKLLVVAPNIKLAKRYRAKLSSSFHCEIATSEDSPTARTRIRQFKGLDPPECDVLVTVAMAYEGLSVPEVTHIACLTHIRSVPWLEQCFARANRLAHGKTRGVVYGPDDPKFREAIAAIENEQRLVFATPESRVVQDGSSRERSESSGEARPFVEPLFSRAHYEPGVAPTIDHRELPLTPSETEKLLRSQIHQHIEIFLSEKRPGAKASWLRVINHAVRRVCQKPRAEMSAEELTAVWQMILDAYPLERGGTLQ